MNSWLGKGFLIFASFSLLLLMLLDYAYSNNQDPLLIGIASWAENAEYEKNIQGFKQALENAGYLENKNVIYNIQSANTEPETQRNIIQSFIDQKVDLIYSLTTPGTLIAKEMTDNKEIPTVFSIVTYPVETGIVDSLKNSGNHLTGTRNWVDISKQLDVFLELVPDVTSIALVRHSNETNSLIQLEEMKELASNKGIRVIQIDANSLQNLSEKLSNLKEDIQSFYISCDTLMETGGELLIINFAKSRKLPTFTCLDSGVQQGALISLSANLYEIGKMAGEKAGMIFNGVDTDVLEITTINKPSIQINEKIADELSIVIPQHLYMRAEKIIR